MQVGDIPSCLALILVHVHLIRNQERLAPFRAEILETKLLCFQVSIDIFSEKPSLTEKL